MVNEQVFGLIMKGTHCSGLAREGLPLPPTSRPHIVLGLKMKKTQPLSSNDKKKKKPFTNLGSKDDGRKILPFIY